MRLLKNALQREAQRQRRFGSFKSAVICLFAFCLILVSVSSEAAGFAVARLAAPVLNSPDLGKVFGGRDGKTIRTDGCGQVRELEFIALPGTVFRLTDELRRGNHTIYRVETDDYPAPPGISLYLDSRFAERSEKLPPARKRQLPSRQAIVSAMKSASGSAYVWGGNVRRGIPELFSFYYKSGLAANRDGKLSLAGLDCSGLLYETTNGWTPRNTSALVRYGDGVPVAGMSAGEIAAVLEPLDLIVWNGHVLIVLDRETIIESRLECGAPGNGGVGISSLKKRLTGIMKTRRPVDVWPYGSKKRDVFVVRRWYPI